MSSSPQPTSTSSLENAKNAVVGNAAAAASAVQNHPLTQSITNGPVAENVKNETAKTQADFSNLAAARTPPTQPAATGQQLTHYHSFFSSLLSWEHPRASGIAYIATVVFIFFARYVDVLRYTFKAAWVVLGITAAAELAGQAVFSQGFVSSVRPRKYYTVPKETLDSLIGDVHELINFFVIEIQRIVFAENVFATVAAFLGAFFSYYLIKIVPVWGLALISTSVLFLAPLIYKTNKEFIDHHLANASSVVNEQTAQVKQLASQHAARATDVTKQYVGDYSAKAQEMIGARSRSVSPIISKTEAPLKKETNGSSLKADVPAYKDTDFPAAPKEEFQPTPSVGDTASALRDEDEPLIAT
ncbi:hypothetical protein B7494_g1655 [Chlorociboria aeruginascens]|nr:hypothetical protein B7494_g1655 [Chlorociboria aeruginascens]